MGTTSNLEPISGAIPAASKAKPTASRSWVALNTARAPGNEASSMSRAYSLRRRVGAAFGVLTLMAGTAAALTTVAAPTAGAMKAECENHLRAAGWAYDHGMDDVGDIEYYAWVDCMRS